MSTRPFALQEPELDDEYRKKLPGTSVEDFLKSSPFAAPAPSGGQRPSFFETTKEVLKGAGEEITQHPLRLAETALGSAALSGATELALSAIPAEAASGIGLPLAAATFLFAFWPQIKQMWEEGKQAYREGDTEAARRLGAEAVETLAAGAGAGGMHRFLAGRPAGVLSLRGAEAMRVKLPETLERIRPIAAGTAGRVAQTFEGLLGSPSAEVRRYLGNLVASEPEILDPAERMLARALESFPSRDTRTGFSLEKFVRALEIDPETFRSTLSPAAESDLLRAAAALDEKTGSPLGTALLKTREELLRLGRMYSGEGIRPHAYVSPTGHMGIGLRGGIGEAIMRPIRKARELPLLPERLERAGAALPEALKLPEKLPPTEPAAPVVPETPAAPVETPPVVENLRQLKFYLGTVGEKTFRQAERIRKNPVFAQWMTNIARQVTSRLGIEIERLNPVNGFWKGGYDPTAEIHFRGTLEQAEQIARTMGGHRGAVAMFSEDPEGPGLGVFLKPKGDIEKFFERLYERLGIEGATLLNDGRIFVGFENQGEAKRFLARMGDLYGKRDAKRPEFAPETVPGHFRIFETANPEVGALGPDVRYGVFASNLNRKLNRILKPVQQIATEIGAAINRGTFFDRTGAGFANVVLDLRGSDNLQRILDIVAQEKVPTAVFRILPGGEDLLYRLADTAENRKALKAMKIPFHVVSRDLYVLDKDSKLMHRIAKLDVLDTLQGKIHFFREGNLPVAFLRRAAPAAGAAEAAGAAGAGEATIPPARQMALRAMESLAKDALFPQSLEGYVRQIPELASLVRQTFGHDLPEGVKALLALFFAGHSGQSPLFDNYREAVQHLAAFLKSGRAFEDGTDVKGTAGWVSKTVPDFARKLNRLVDLFGVEGTLDFLVTKHSTQWLRDRFGLPKDTEAYFGGADRVPKQLPGAFIIGPKEASFFLNLTGDRSWLTLDVWAYRAFVHVAKEVGILPADFDESASERLPVALRAMARDFYSELARLLSERLERRVEPADAQAAVWSWFRQKTLAERPPRHLVAQDRGDALQALDQLGIGLAHQRRDLARHTARMSEIYVEAAQKLQERRPEILGNLVQAVQQLAGKPPGPVKSLEKVVMSEPRPEVFREAKIVFPRGVKMDFPAGVSTGDMRTAVEMLMRYHLPSAMYPLLKAMGETWKGSKIARVYVVPLEEAIGLATARPRGVHPEQYAAAVSDEIGLFVRSWTREYNQEFQNLLTEIANLPEGTPIIMLNTRYLGDLAMVNNTVRAVFGDRATPSIWKFASNVLNHVLAEEAFHAYQRANEIPVVVRLGGETRTVPMGAANRLPAPFGLGQQAQEFVARGLGFVSNVADNPVEFLTQILVRVAAGDVPPGELVQAWHQLAAKFPAAIRRLMPKVIGDSPKAAAAVTLLTAALAQLYGLSYGPGEERS